MKKIGRKDFLKIGAGAIAGGLAGTVFSGAPFKGLQWLTERTQDMYRPKEGIETYLKTICSSCRNKCEMSIRMIGARAVSINTSNVMCPIGINTLQLLYHPEKINTPLKRTGRKGCADLSDFEKISWESAIQDISSRIKAEKPDQIAAINKNYNLSSALLERLIYSTGSMNNYYEPGIDSITKSAMGGYADYDFTGTDLVLSFGARLFEGWGNGNIWKVINELINKKVRIIQIDSVCTRTASMTEWVNINPGSELFAAIGIANYLIKAKGKSTGNSELDSIINNFNMNKAVKLTGINSTKFKELAEILSSAKKPVAIAGKGGRGVSSSYSEIALIHALNTMTGSRSASINKYEYFDNTEFKNNSNKHNKYSAGIDDFIQNSDFNIMIINESDPVYKSVLSDILIKKLSKAFVISITTLLNDSAMYADYILPPVTVIENDISSAIQTGDVKHTGDIIIELAKKINPVKKYFIWKNYNDALINSRYTTTKVNPVFDTNTISAQLKQTENNMDKSDLYPLNLLPAELSFVGDGDGMAFPYVLKTIDAKTFSGGKLWASINRETAIKNSITEGNIITIESSRGKVAVKAHITDIVPPGTITAPIGFGHKAYTKYAAGKGENLKKIMNDSIDPITGCADWWLTKVKI